MLLIIETLAHLGDVTCVYACVYTCICEWIYTPTRYLNTELSLLFCQTLFLSLHYIKRLKAILPLERIIIILQYFFRAIGLFTERRSLYRKYVLFMYNMQSLILQFWKRILDICISGQVNTLYSHIHGVFSSLFLSFVLYNLHRNKIHRIGRLLLCAILQLPSMDHGTFLKPDSFIAKRFCSFSHRTLSVHFCKVLRIKKCTNA